MNTQLILTKMPRILGLALVLLCLLFSLDAFNDEGSFQEKLPDFMMHLIPALIIGVIVLVGWKFPLWGGMLFILLSLIYSYSAREHVSWIVTIGLPLMVIGILYILSHFSLKKIPKTE